MSKVDQMRALREAKWSHRATAPTAASRPKPTSPPPTATFSAAPQPVTAPRPPQTTPKTPEQPATPAPTSPPVQAAHTTPSARTKPDLTPGKPIGSYKQSDLVALVGWILSDGKPRTEAEVIETVMAELGFVRQGKNIRTRIGDAISTVNGTAAAAS